MTGFDYYIVGMMVCVIFLSVMASIECYKNPSREFAHGKAAAALSFFTTILVYRFWG